MCIELGDREIFECRDLVREIERRGARRASWPARIGWRVLRKHAGLVRLLPLLASAIARIPFVRFGNGPAWLPLAGRRFAALAALYRAARGMLGPEKAEALARDLLLGMGILEWCRVMPRRDVGGAGPAAFMEYFRGKVKPVMGRYSEDEYALRGDAEMTLTVTSCMFLRVFESLGIRELAPYLCQTDRIYLGFLAPGIAFSRDGVLSEGSARCVFRFTWAPKPLELTSFNPFPGEISGEDRSRALPGGEMPYNRVRDGISSEVPCSIR
jgi:hypothetical protein